MERLPHVQFTNLYGPTETTIASSYYTVPGIPAEAEAIPIGIPCGGEDLLVLDESLSPVKPGETGDIYIAGSGLSPGYWHDDERTRAAFFAAPLTGRKVYRTGDLGRIGENGQLYFLGRTDSQVKSRGYRIELGEIETALSTCPELRESAVIAALSTDFDNLAICCSFVPAPGSAADPAAVRMYLKDKLPTYMLPSRWMALKDLPRNANGKLDRRKLHELFETQQARTSPS